MKSHVSRLLSGLFIIALSFSCSNSNDKPEPAQLSVDQILAKAERAKARKADYPASVAFGSWKLLAVHNADNEAHSGDNDACYANVVWNLNPGTPVNTWQVLNYSGGSCGQYNDSKFSSWMQSSGYSQDKNFELYQQGSQEYIFFRQGNQIYWYGPRYIVDNKYMVIYNTFGGDVILYRDPVQ